MAFESLREITSLKKYLWRFRLDYARGLLCLTLSVLFTLLIPRMLKEAIDSIKIGASSEILVRYAGIIILFALIQGLFKFRMRNILIGISRRIEYLIRNDFFAHLQSLSLSFFQQTRTGDLMSRATNDLNTVRNLLGPGFMFLAHTFVLFLLDFGFMLTINPKLTFYILITIPLVSLIISVLAQKLHLRSMAVQEQFSVLNSRIQENFSGIRVVKAYAREEEMANEFQEVNNDYLKKNMDLVKIWGFSHPLTSFLGGFFTLLILRLGGKQVIHGQLSIGGLAAFMSYVGLLLWPAMTIGWIINLFQRGAASLTRLNEIFRIEPEIKDLTLTNSIPSLNGEIEFDHIDFAYYPKGPMVLQDISFKIKPGECIGFFGRTGAGKSTLVNLIPRLYDVISGEIRIDGLPVTNIPLSFLRENIGYVPQETFIFSDSIKRNIGLGLKKETLDQVKEAAIFSHLLNDIEDFPEKFETMVGERGVTLSGGQKQRLAISRALIRKPPILIFDDVFSSVDLQTEYQILEKIHTLVKGRTSIIIAHRISALKNCDKIYVLEQGRIIESGDHKSLIVQNGLYAQMYQKQSLIEDLEEEK